MCRLAIAPVLLAGAILACPGTRRPSAQREGRETTVAARDINAVLAAHVDSLMSMPGVVGTAIALCGTERCIKVLIADSSAARRIPTRLEGYRVVTEVTGTLRPR